MAKKGAFRGGGMPGGMNNMMKQVQKMQRQMEEAQKEVEELTVSAASGGGAVEVTVNGSHEMVSIRLDEEVVDPDDIEMLQDLIVAATNEAMRSLAEKSDSIMSQVSGLGGGLGAGLGSGLGGLPF